MTPAPRATGELVIAPRPFDDPEVQRLVAALLDDLVERYGGDDDAPPTTAEQFAPPRGTFLLAARDGTPVGCGGIRPAGDRVAEIKRMWVEPPARGQGVARALLRALEETARSLGHDRLRLETGLSQPEAIALYTSAGYAPCAPFGFYARYPNARFYAKPL